MYVMMVEFRARDGAYGMTLVHQSSVPKIGPCPLGIISLLYAPVPLFLLDISHLLPSYSYILLPYTPEQLLSISYLLIQLTVTATLVFAFSTP